MDLSSLLPLLMAKSGAGNDKMSTLLKMTRGEKPDINTVMNMAMNNKKNTISGLSPVAEIASYEILGKLTKCFTAK